MRKGALMPWFAIIQRRVGSHSIVRDMTICLKLPIVPYIVGTNSECSDKTVRLQE